MNTINMKKTCDENGITSFSRSRGGWMKLVEGYDDTKYGGYRFVGDQFVKVGNFDTELQNGLYIDCSKPVIDGEKVEIMNLFKIHDGNVELLNTIPKSTKKWANKFQNDVEEYFNNGVTSEEIMDAIESMSCNKDVLHEVAMTILEKQNEKVWLNESHFGAFMKEACVYNANFELKNSHVQKMAVELFYDHYKAEEYFNYEISNEHQATMLYSLIHAHPFFKEYRDYTVEFEKISEGHYINLNNVKKLRDYNYNEITKGASHDLGHWVSFGGIYATEKVIYIIVPNVAHETLKIQRFVLHL